MKNYNFQYILGKINGAKLYSVVYNTKSYIIGYISSGRKVEYLTLTDKQILNLFNK